MFYVKKDETGKIIGVCLNQEDGAEPAELTDPGVREFLAESDFDIIRVLEDLIDVLVNKNVISITDLPTSAQLKLLYRKNTRSFLDDSNPLLVDDENIF